MQVSRLQHEPKGVLRVNAPMSFGALYLGSAIADFMVALSRSQDRTHAHRPFHRSDRGGRGRHDPDRGTE